MLTRRPRGTEDLVDEIIPYWRFMEDTVRELCANYGYEEIRTPIFEHTELFNRSVGETTDIVEKEMYSFMDRGNRSITLRPEGTAAVVRAYLENRLYAGPQPSKLFYLGPMFRYGRPQAGRLRQFHQFGVEVFGTDHPALDAEVIALAMDFYTRLGLKDLELHLNSVGCPECRPLHREKLQEHFRPHLAELCGTCRDRFERNPLRILDCKSEKCQELAKGAPQITKHLCSPCEQHFLELCRYVDRIGITYIIDSALVRGLDYYTNTAFEIEVKGIGAQSSIGGGGRYNGLVEEIGGKDAPGIGFGLGLERVVLAMKEQGVNPRAKKAMEVYVITAGEDLEEESFILVQELRRAGICADRDYLGKSVKAQFKNADKYGASYTVVLGSEEISRGVVGLRDMSSGEQLDVRRKDLIDTLQRKRSENK